MIWRILLSSLMHIFNCHEMIFCIVGLPFFLSGFDSCHHVLEVDALGFDSQPARHMQTARGAPNVAPGMCQVSCAIPFEFAFFLQDPKVTSGHLSREKVQNYVTHPSDEAKS